MCPKEFFTDINDNTLAGFVTTFHVEYRKLRMR